jgi:hypothetical protein
LTCNPTTAEKRLCASQLTPLVKWPDSTDTSGSSQFTGEHLAKNAIRKTSPDKPPLSYSMQLCVNKSNDGSGIRAGQIIRDFTND